MTSDAVPVITKPTLTKSLALKCAEIYPLFWNLVDLWGKDYSLLTEYENLLIRHETWQIVMHFNITYATKFRYYISNTNQIMHATSAI